MNSYKFDEIEIGHKESFQVQITREMEDRFREITGDHNPLHCDDAFAKKVGNGRFQSHVTFGMLTASLYSTLAGVYLPGKYSLIHSLDVKFQNPVYVGNQLNIEGIVTDKQEALRLLLVKVRITNEDRQCVSKADMKILVLSEGEQ